MIEPLQDWVIVDDRPKDQFGFMELEASRGVVLALGPTVSIVAIGDVVRYQRHLAVNLGNNKYALIQDKIIGKEK